ncbi:aminotransferase-like mobile domain-containing protein [Tanacetum coccineum]
MNNGQGVECATSKSNVNMESERNTNVRKKEGKTSSKKIHTSGNMREARTEYLDMLFLPYLMWNRAENSSPNRFTLLVDKYNRIIIKLNLTPITPTLLHGSSDNHAIHDLSFLPLQSFGITLEDILVIGGFPILGRNIFDDVGSDVESEKALGSLRVAMTELGRSSYRNVSHGGWIKMFKDIGSEFEHEAFLALWLS